MIYKTKDIELSVVAQDDGTYITIIDCKDGKVTTEVENFEAAKEWFIGAVRIEVSTPEELKQVEAALYAATKRQEQEEIDQEILDKALFSQGETVVILGIELILKVDNDYIIGQQCEIKDVGTKDGALSYAVYTEDHSDYWYFEEKDLGKV